MYILEKPYSYAFLFPFILDTTLPLIQQLQKLQNIKSENASQPISESQMFNGSGGQSPNTHQNHLNTSSDALANSTAKDGKKRKQIIQKVKK